MNKLQKVAIKAIISMFLFQFNFELTVLCILNFIINRNI